MSDKMKKAEDAARRVLRKFDPPLIRIALQEMQLEMKTADDKDAERVKKTLRDLYDSLPAEKKRYEILVSALKGLHKDVMAEEVLKVKTELQKLEISDLRQVVHDVAPELSSMTCPSNMTCLWEEEKATCNGEPAAAMPGGEVARALDCIPVDEKGTCNGEPAPAMSSAKHDWCDVDVARESARFDSVMEVIRKYPAVGRRLRMMLQHIKKDDE